MTRYQLAFYIAPGKPLDRAIRLITGESMSHVEFVDTETGYWHSSSARDGGVRAKRINPKAGRWLFVDLHDRKPAGVGLIQYKNKNKRYSYLGALAAAVGWRWLRPAGATYCADYCAELAGIAIVNPTPYQLYCAAIGAKSQIGLTNKESPHRSNS